MKLMKAYNIATTIVGYTPEKIDEAKSILLKNLNRLEALEIANKNNEGLVRENVKLINRNLKLQDENQKLKEQIDELETRDAFGISIIDNLQKENEELKQYKDILEEYGLDLESPKIRDVLICGLMYKDYQKAIKILKSKGLKLKHYPKNKNHEFVLQFIGWEYMFKDLSPYEYELLEELLADE